MGQEDRGTDAVEQRRAGITIQFLLPRKACQRWIVLRVELIEDGIARDASARPLGVELGLWPEVRALWRREPLLHPFYGGARLRADFRLMGRPGTRRLVEDVDGVSLTQEILHPAFAAIRSACVVQPTLTSAREHDNRIGVGELCWNLELDVHLARHEPAALRVVVLAADEEVSLLGDDQRWGLRSEAGDEKADGESNGHTPVGGWQHVHCSSLECVVG